MKLRAILAGMDYEIIQHGDHDEVTSITHDSRKCAENCLFVCFRGMRVDGHAFIKEVARAGAAAVMIDQDQQDYPPGLTIVKVSHTRKALCRAAANFYQNPDQKLRLFGVTGTNGKTSTAYFLETILQVSGRTVGLIGTVDTRVGGEPVNIPFDTSTTPDTLELQQILAHMRDKAATDCVMEVSSHALTLHKLEGMMFEAGLFTNLSRDHLDFHGTMENYLNAKTQLFTQCKIGIINADDASASVLMQRGRCAWLTYGIQNECDLRAVHIAYLPEGSSFEVEIDGVTEHFFLPVKGKYNIYNALAAIGAALSANVPLTEIRDGLAAIQGVPGRIESIPNPHGFHVLVDFAHTPDGLVNIISAVREFTTGRVVTLFGCGGDKDKGKRPIMGRLAGELSDYCIITSDNPRSEAPEQIIRQIEEGLQDTHCPYEKEVDRRSAILKGVAMLQAGDALIIAGKGHEQYQIIGDSRLHFDDAETAREALDKTR